MKVYNRLIKTNVKWNGKKYQCEIKPVYSHLKDSDYSFPRSVENLQGEAQWYAKVSYIIAALISSRFRIDKDDDNGVITGIMYYSKYSAKFKKFSEVYSDRYYNWDWTVEKNQELLLRDTEKLGQIIEPLIRVLLTKELFEKAKRKAHIIYKRKNAPDWHNGRVNRRSVSNCDYKEKPIDYSYFRALELYKKVNHWYNPNTGRWEFDIISADGQGIPEKEIIQKEVQEYWGMRTQ